VAVGVAAVVDAAAAAAVVVSGGGVAAAVAAAVAAVLVQPHCLCAARILGAQQLSCSVLQRALCELADLLSAFVKELGLSIVRAR